MKSAHHNIIIGWLLLAIFVIVAGFTIRLKEKERQLQALLTEANYQIRFIKDRGLLPVYDWQRKHGKAGEF